MSSAQREPTSRLFTAIDLSDRVREDVSDVIDALSGEVDGVRWVRRENLHVTLRFLGEFPLREVDGFVVWMRKAAAHLPLCLTVGGVGGFPSSGSARVLWVGAKDATERIEKVYNVLDKGASRFGLQRESRKYRPHITIGRAKHPVRVPESLRERFEGRAADLEVSEIVLYSSRLDSSGATYTALERIGSGSIV